MAFSLLFLFLAQLDDAVAQHGGILELEHPARLLHLLFELADLLVPLALRELALAAPARAVLVLLGDLQDLAHVLADGLRGHGKTFGKLVDGRIAARVEHVQQGLMAFRCLGHGVS